MRNFFEIWINLLLCALALMYVLTVGTLLIVAPNIGVLFNAISFTLMASPILTFVTFAFAISLYVLKGIARYLAILAVSAITWGVLQAIVSCELWELVVMQRAIHQCNGFRGWSDGNIVLVPLSACILAIGYPAFMEKWKQYKNGNK